MSTSLLTNHPVTPNSRPKNDKLITPTDSSEILASEKYDTNQSNTKSKQTTSAHSNSSLTNSISTHDSDYDYDTTLSLTESSSSNIPNTKTVTNLILENDEAEFFTIISSKNTTMTQINNKNDNMKKSIKNHHKIRSSFRNKFHRSYRNTSDIGIDNSNEVLPKTSLKMKQDMNGIIVDFYQTNEKILDKSSLNVSKNAKTTCHLSLHEHQRAKNTMMKTAHLFDQAGFLNNNNKRFPYPYIDIIQGKNVNLLYSQEQVTSKNLLIQNKPLRHKKVRYRTQRRLLKVQHDLNTVKNDLPCRKSKKSHEELSSLNVENYQTRLRKNLLKVRNEIADYNVIDSSTDDHEEKTDQTTENMKTTKSVTQSQTEGYQKKLIPIEMVKKRRKDLISTPFIPRRARWINKNIEKDNNNNNNNNNRPIDSRFDSTTFIDLYKEAEEFFGSDLPFWDLLPHFDPSLSLSSIKSELIHFGLPAKLIVLASLMDEDKIKHLTLHDVEFSKMENYNNDLFNQSSESDDEFFDCYTSLTLEQRKLQELP